ADGNTNPYAGYDTYTGSDPGQVIGKWAWSYVDIGRYLPNSAGAQAYTIRLRWDVGTDFCSGQIGWYVDDVELFTCRPNRGNSN
ncbi:MAG TPA: hypothetical protein VKP13_15215, partial [Nitrospira sp.]|nr:hypothetical protein [Nitrospira sp.]